ncbi:Type III restriction enzyme, res subunit [Aliiruegeria lutimaris]|uniref:Type III restriction enzyme, res subunit n=1 Tax=Aliiruegeria lutimaris TaxID=571298 RepID=A0A1G9J3I1_9RHOB|nr:Type III restriction enzyme, res subunit [Aliiruegeria lutimaris]
MKGGRRFDHAKRVTISTLQTMVNEYDQLSPGYFDLVITDECHRSIYGKWSGVLRHFDGIQMGLTATPCRVDTDDLPDPEDGLYVRDKLRFFELDRPTFSYSLQQAVSEATRYAVGTMRATVGSTDTTIFYGYVPFRLTPHALYRLIERSQEAYSFQSAGVRALASVASSLSEIVQTLPIMVLGGMFQPNFALRVADGILLCELFEETTYYEATYTSVSASGVLSRHARSVFGNPEAGVSRVILAKTWIGPNEIRSKQWELLNQTEELLAAETHLTKRFMQADFFRTPNWIDHDEPDYQNINADAIANLAVPISKILASDAYRAQFVPSNRR